MNKGFTLIELLVVVLIIGILAAVALPQYQKAVAKARATNTLAFLNAVAKGVDLYELENGFPANTSDSVNFFSQDGVNELNVDVSSYIECGQTGYYYCHSKQGDWDVTYLSCSSDPDEQFLCYGDLTSTDYDYEVVFGKGRPELGEGWSWSCYPTSNKFCTAFNGLTPQ